MKKTDAELVTLTFHDSEVFGVLMRRYEQKLLRYIHRLRNISREEGQDILQEGFIKAYQGLHDFDNTLSFSSWMYRIVHNVAISAWRRSRVRPDGNISDVDDAFWLRIISDGDVCVDIDMNIQRAQIQRVFASMDEKYRIVMMLFYFEDKSYKEISDILKKPMGTVAILLNRAKKQFRLQCKQKNILFDS